MKNDAVRSDKKKEEESINLLSDPGHKPIDSEIILPNTDIHIETITTIQPTGKHASIKQNPSYLGCEYDPLESKKPNDEQVTVQSHGTCASQNPVSIHMEQIHLQYSESYYEISGCVQQTGRNASSNQVPNYLEYGHDT